jgi:hypothetical protein
LSKIDGDEFRVVSDVRRLSRIRGVTPNHFATECGLRRLNHLHLAMRLKPAGVHRCNGQVPFFTKQQVLAAGRVSSDKRIAGL